MATHALRAETRYTFQVTRSFRPASADTVEVTAGNDGASCGIRFEQGQEYLIFARQSGGTLRTDLCSGSLPTAFAGAALRFLAAFPPGVPTAHAVVVYGVVTQRERDLIRGTAASWPAAGVRVIAWRGIQPLAETTTAEDGTYAFYNLAEGPYRISVEGLGDFRTRRAGSLADAAPGRCTEVSFFNAARARMGGILRDAEGELDDATDVVLVPIHGVPKPIPGEDSELETDTNSGVFLLEVPPGRYRLGFRELGYTDLVYYPGELVLEAGLNPDIEFQLPGRPQQEVEGVVVDSSGSPVQGARISLHGRAPDGAMISGSAVTSESGRFRFLTMPLDYEIRLRVPSCGDAFVAHGTVRKGHRSLIRLETPSQCP